MAIIAIGLLGVAAMFPVGVAKVSQAVQSDRASTLGQAAFDEIKTRGLLNPADDTTNPRPGEWVRPRLHDGVGTGIPVAVDPLGSAAGDAITGIELFPISSGAPTLTRVTYPDATLSNIVSASLAETVFRARDDLEYTLPDDRDQPAQQMFKRVNPLDSSSVALQRQYHGDYSWMFTAVPQIETDIYGNLHATGRYTVSVVVFYKRLLVDADNSLSPEVPEHMVQVDNTPGDGSPDGLVVGGLGGVEANLYTNTTVARQYLERIRPGDWALLSAKTTTGTIFKWYRVTSREDEIQGVGPFTRWVSLAGGDLIPPSNDWNQWLDADGNGRVEPARGEGVHISLFDGAIAVFERTMGVEGDTLY